MRKLSPTTSSGGAIAPAEPARLGPGAVFAQLTKAKLSLLVLWTTAVGFVIGARGVTVAAADAATIFVVTLLGTALAAGCANTLNQVLEVERDAAMERTRTRPLPSGSIERIGATLLALAMGVIGVGLLYAFVNGIAAVLAAVTIVLYVLVYTPMKTWSTLNTLVGAVCGAIPPMIGWVAITGRLDAGAWALGGLLFVWQIPHFLALAWLYRDDYAKGRFAMLPVFDPTGRITCEIVIVTTLMLVPIALTVTMLGHAGWIYSIGSVALALWWFTRGLKLYKTRDRSDARRVFFASLVYLTAVLMLLVIDPGPLTEVVEVHSLAMTAAP